MKQLYLCSRNAETWSLLVSKAAIKSAIWEYDYLFASSGKSSNVPRHPPSTVMPFFWVSFNCHGLGL